MAQGNFLTNNPFTRKLKDISNSFVGLVWGVVLFFVSLALLYMSFQGVEERSVYVATLDEYQGQEIKDGDDGEAIFTGEVTDGLYDLELTDENGDLQYALNSLLFYEIDYQILEVEKDVERQQTNEGAENPEYTDIEVYEEEWNTFNTVTFSAEFKLEDVEVVKIDEFDFELDTENETVEDVYVADAPRPETYGQENLSDKIGTVRAKISYYTVDNDLTVVGEKDGDKIEPGTVSLVADMDKEDLVVSLQESEEGSRLGFRMLAWGLMTLALYLFVGPLLELIEMIPLVGKAAKTASFFIAVIMAGTIVWMTVFIINYWYIILGLIFATMAAAALLIYRKNSQTTSNNQTADGSKESPSN